MGLGLARSQSSGNRVDRLLFHSPAGDTLFQVRFQDAEGGRVVRSHYDREGFLLFRAVSDSGSGVYEDAAGTTLYRSRQSQSGDSMRLEISDALGRTLIGASLTHLGQPAGSFTVRPDSLVGESKLRYVSTADGRTDSIYVGQGGGSGGLTHIVKVHYRTDARIGKPQARPRVVGFTYANPGQVRIRFTPETAVRKISADLYRMDGTRLAGFAETLPAGDPEYLLDFGCFSGKVPAGVHIVRFFVGSEEMFRFRLTRP